VKRFRILPVTTGRPVPGKDANARTSREPFRITAFHPKNIIVE
jgi:hypothetical protein